MQALGEQEREQPPTVHLRACHNEAQTRLFGLHSQRRLWLWGVSQTKRDRSIAKAQEIVDALCARWAELEQAQG
jgi:hypothetical protein